MPRGRVLTPFRSRSDTMLKRARDANKKIWVANFWCLPWVVNRALISFFFFKQNSREPLTIHLMVASSVGRDKFKFHYSVRESTVARCVWVRVCLMIEFQLTWVAEHFASLDWCEIISLSYFTTEKIMNFARIRKKKRSSWGEATKCTAIYSCFKDKVFWSKKLLRFCVYFVNLSCSFGGVCTSRIDKFSRCGEGELSHIQNCLWHFEK